jgi:hypothetical protein
LIVPASNQSTIPKTILSIFLAVAVLMLTIAAISAISSGRALAREITAPGTVVDLAIRQATDGTLYYRPVVAFALPDGDRRTLQVAEESTDPVYKVDQAVTIAYDPARPDNARIQSASSTLGLWILPSIMGVLGATFLAATLFARRVLASGDE